ncbi:WD40 repeat domain-containing protein [bacterium]|nr:WD40 repeat domain-containing protein [bacterium]
MNQQRNTKWRIAAWQWTVWIAALCALSSAASGEIPSERLWGLGEVYDASFSPDGDWIVTVTSVGVQIWDARAELVMHSRRDFDYKIDFAKWSPDGTMLALISEYSDVQLIVNFPTLDTITEIDSNVHVPKIRLNSRSSNSYHSHGALIHGQSANFSPDSQTIALISRDRKLLIVDAHQGNIMFSKQYDENLDSVFFLTNEVVFYNIEKLNYVSGEIISDGYGDRTISISPDGKYIFKYNFKKGTDPSSHQSQIYLYSEIYKEGNEKVLLELGSLLLFGVGEWNHLPQRIQFVWENDQWQPVVYASGMRTMNTIYFVDLKDSSYIQTKKIEVTPFYAPFSPNADSCILYQQQLIDSILGLMITSTDDDSSGIGENPYTEYTFFPGDHAYSNMYFDPNKPHSLISTQEFSTVARLRSDVNAGAFKVNIHNPETGEIEYIEREGGMGIIGEVSKDGERFLTVSSPRLYKYGNLTVNDADAHLYSTEDWSIQQTFSLEGAIGTTYLPFSPDGQYFIISPWLYDSDSNEKIARGINLSFSSLSIDFIYDDASRVISGGRDFTDWTPENGSIAFGVLGQWFPFEDRAERLTEFDSPVVYIKALLDNSTALLVLENGEVWKYNIDNDEKNYLFTGTVPQDRDDQPKVKIEEYAVLLSPDESMLFLGNDVWRMSDGKRLATYGKAAVRMSSIHLSPDGEYLAAGYRDGTIRTWRLDEILQHQSAAEDVELYK